MRDRQLEVAQAALEAAIEKRDTAAMRLVLDRLIAKASDQPVEFDPVTKLETADDIRRENEAIVKAVYTGKISPAQAERLQGILQTYAESIREAAAGDRRKEFELDERVVEKIRARPRLFRAACKLLDFYQAYLEAEDLERRHPITVLPQAVVGGKPN